LFLGGKTEHTAFQQSQQGFDVSLKLRETVCRIPIVRKPPRAAPKRFQGILDHADFQRSSFLRSGVLFLDQTVKETFGIRDAAKVQLISRFLRKQGSDLDVSVQGISLPEIVVQRLR